MNNYTISISCLNDKTAELLLKEITLKISRGVFDFERSAGDFNYSVVTKLICREKEEDDDIPLSNNMGEVRYSIDDEGRKVKLIMSKFK